MRFDLHTHTTCSFDGTIPPADLATAALSAGLDGVCVTDHQNMAIRHHLIEGRQENGVVIVFGMEYETTDGDFLLFGPFEDLAAGMPAPDLLATVQRAGGVAIAAHPFRRLRPTNPLLVRTGLCRLIEGINGRNTALENLRIRRWENRYTITMVGGSDAHTREELGRFYTRFADPINSRSDLINALKKGRCVPEVSQCVNQATAQ